MDETNSARADMAAAVTAADYGDAARRLTRDAAGMSLLPLLHALQDIYGYIDDAMVSVVADALNLSRADVHGVVTFYHDFRRAPAGRHVIRLCRAESCQARGGAAIERLALDTLGLAMGETSLDGRVTIEAVYCLGLCAIGPNAMVDGVPVSRIDSSRIARIIERAAA